MKLNQDLITGQEKGLQILIDTIINDIRHPYYTRNKERAERWISIVSGDGLDKYLRRFAKRESTEMFDQRKRLTKHIIQSVCKNVRDIEYKIPRSNSIQKAIVKNDQAGAKEVAELYEILGKFWGNSSFDDWVETRWIELNDTDPNSFVVFEWEDFDETERANPYPFEVLSEMAINYKYKMNQLLWLIVKKNEPPVDDKPVCSFTIYLPNESIKFIEIPEPKSKPSVKGVIQDVIIDGEPAQWIWLDNDEVYKVLMPEPHNLEYVPALRIGYIRDQYTKGKTFLPPWWAAEPVLLNILGAKSELDLSIALHTFPQKLQYMNRCSNRECNGGSLPTGNTCPTCHGTGYQIINTAQESITLPMPKDKEEMLDLSGLVHYIYPPVDLIKFQDEYIDGLSSKCLKFVYNSEIYSKKEVAETATGKNIDLQAVYDTLYPMVVKMAKDWEQGVMMVADITDLSEGLIAAFTYSKDFKLKTLEDYLYELKLVKDSGGSPFIKDLIEEDVARLAFADDSIKLQQYLTRRYFNPFSGDEKEVVSMKMTQSFISERTKILWSNFNIIFDLIEMDKGANTFYNMTRKKQWEIINEYIDIIIETLEEESPLPAPNFQTPPDEGEENNQENEEND